MNEYDVVQDTNLNDFIESVNGKLKEGWILVGGISVITGWVDYTGERETYTVYYQAIVKMTPFNVVVKK